MRYVWVCLVVSCAPAESAEWITACDYDGDSFDGPHCGGNDCCDLDGDTWPGNREFHLVPNQCGSWDYDCNGVAEWQFVALASACEMPECELIEIGWRDDTTVACGHEDTVRVACEAINDTVCLEVVESRIQRCK